MQLIFQLIYDVFIQTLILFHVLSYVALAWFIFACIGWIVDKDKNSREDTRMFKHLLNWLFPKRYFVEFEATDFDGINWSQVKVIKANSESEARYKFDWWAMKQDFWRYSVMDIREVHHGRRN